MDLNSYGSHVRGKSARMAIRLCLTVGTESKGQSPGDEGLCNSARMAMMLIDLVI